MFAWYSYIEKLGPFALGAPGKLWGGTELETDVNLETSEVEIPILLLFLA